MASAAGLLFVGLPPTTEEDRGHRREHTGREGSIARPRATDAVNSVPVAPGIRGASVTASSTRKNPNADDRSSTTLEITIRRTTIRRIAGSVRRM